ncbi:luciferase family oxidoreductase, group 1 [Paenibacillus tianmuensis]|uniref:Luciferase family oxidoreductase, group 1 n=1 Tax=Paenibacillus tianmuensis TaxID=624147 RepID=A0A1G4RD75_9BACL|nr:MsnO8 family LLM class oxidoreductase [Paenibacillus tianmuensis]SCW54824.1 luciferase family oxidoreductase, group 1 [Paenibacillus tianmuensis]
MKLSLLDLVPLLEGADAVTALAQARRLAQTAEKLGYSRYWAAEHHDLPGLACPAPEVLLSHIGAHTERIRLGSGALLLPHYKPIKVAETFRLLAALYPGRIDLGIGRAPGGSAHMSMALSGNFLENVRQLPESLRSLSALLVDEFRVEDVPVRAMPVPPADPEVWLLGTNQKSASYAAEFGAGFVFGQFMSDRDGAEVLSAYVREFRPTSLGAAPRAIMAVSVLCADTEEEAHRLASEAKKLLQPEGGSGDDRPKPMIGTPGQVKAALEQLHRDCGFDELMIVTLGPDYESRLRSYELLADAVWGAAGGINTA